MDDDRQHARLFQQHHILGEILGSRRIAHGMAAIFDDDNLLIVALHVRQRLGQRLGLRMDVRKGNLGHGYRLARWLGERRISAP